MINQVADIKSHTDSLKEVNFDLTNTMSLIDKKLKNQRNVFNDILEKIKQENAGSRKRIKQCEQDVENIFLKVNF